jgi:hypothetical protein
MEKHLSLVPVKNIPANDASMNNQTASRAGDKYQLIIQNRRFQVMNHDVKWNILEKKNERK